MRLNVLVLCKNPQSLHLLGAVLDEFEIDQEICASSSEAMNRLSQGHYSALVLDFDLPNAARVARMAHLAAPQARPVVFAMIGALTSIAGTLQAGANFVLYKPLVFEQVARSLRASYGFMRPDRRHTHRKKLETLVYLQFGVAALPAIVLDISESGISLQVPESLPVVRNIPLRFVLPGTSYMVEATGEAIWTDDEGKVGMLFTELVPAARKHLKQWLSQQSGKKRIAHSTPHSERSRAAAVAQ